jgi:hypothetical protein
MDLSDSVKGNWWALTGMAERSVTQRGLRKSVNIRTSTSWATRIESGYNLVRKIQLFSSVHAAA